MIIEGYALLEEKLLGSVGKEEGTIIERIKHEVCSGDEKASLTGFEILYRCGADYYGRQRWGIVQ